MWTIILWKQQPGRCCTNKQWQEWNLIYLQVVEKFVVEYKYKTDMYVKWVWCNEYDLWHENKMTQKNEREREKDEGTEFWNTKQIDATVIQNMPVVVY